MFLEAETVGIFTHAIISPVEESNLSISYASSVVPSLAVKTMSDPSLSVVLVKSEAVNEIKVGKFVRSEPISVFKEVVIFFLCSHESLYQSAAFASKSDGE
uniref:Uncharacterized protein n=1 Tax=uncultured marine thaumarchaeote KM3_28_C05 TaxID=1456112 RepID=A0A075GWY0_9ARCH|nr:hypothetical protein [uncultured marine thaumarchaeote KM3_28_C05]